MAASLLVAVVMASAADRMRLTKTDRSFSHFASIGDFQAYHVALRDALLDSSTRPCCEAIVVPSFQREWSVSVRPSASADRGEVICTVMRDQLWGRLQQQIEGPPRSDAAAALSRLPKDTWRFSAPLSAATAASIEKLWHALLAQAGEPEVVPCFDGTSYHLFQSPPEPTGRAAWSHCPQRGTPPGAMLEILESLRQCAGREGAALTRLDQEIGAAAERLLRIVEGNGGRP